MLVGLQVLYQNIQPRILSIELAPSQVEGGPDDVEEGEEDEAEVLQELRAAAQEELQAA